LTNNRVHSSAGERSDAEAYCYNWIPFSFLLHSL